MPYFTEPEEALDYIYNLLNDSKGSLGLGYVGYADETLLPQYPAVVVSYNSPVERVLATTGTYNLHWAIQILVYHARMSRNHRTRTREDMQIAAAIRDKLHDNYKAGGGVIFGFVTSERPGIAADDKGNANIATMLLWEADSRAPIN
jgi:hypothetical protein